MTEDYRLPPLRARDVVSPVARLLRAGLPGPRSHRAARWQDTGGESPRLNAYGLGSGGLDSVAVQAMRSVMGPSLRREMPVVLAEMSDALAVFADNGWTDDPLSYHRTPTAPRVRTEPFHALESDWTMLLYDSGYEPHPGEPGAHRWMDYRANRQALVRVLRHPEPAPWLVLLHGSFMGNLAMDARVFDPVRMHREHGYNVLMPVLPLHGRRGVSGGVVPRALPSFHALDNVHGLAQAAWDLRRLLAWVRLQDDQPVTLYGMSLGGYVAALAGALLREQPVDRILAGIPAVDFPSIFLSQLPPRAREASWHAEYAAGLATVHAPISVLGLPAPLTRTDRLHIYAAQHDRVLHPLQQAARLWQHWGRPEILWVDGGHLVSPRSKPITTFVNRVLDPVARA